MHLILFDVGGYTIYCYGVLLAVAYLLGLQFGVMRARTRALDQQWITFHHPAAAANRTARGVPLHRTQLYEASAEALIVIVLPVLEWRGRAFPGGTFWSSMLPYGVSRLFIEFYPGDERGIILNTVSTSQFLSLIPVPLAVVMLRVLEQRTDPSRHAAAQRVAA